jgi:peptidylamidoglycolate lyase
MTRLRAAIVLTLAATAVATARQKGGENETGPYTVAPNWPVPVCGQGYQWGSTGGVFAERPDHVFVFMRGCLPALPPFPGIVPPRDAAQYSLGTDDRSKWPKWEHVLMVIDRDGRMIESWDQHNALFVRPHRVLMNPYDPEHHVWLVDDGAHQVFELTHDGKQIVMTLGEHKVPGNDHTHFNRPTDIVWLPNGDFFVSDGYVNTRVVKFSKNGQYLLEWGKPGKGPSEFNTVHALAIDNQRRVYVADRANSRVQIFDEHGKYLDEWNDIRFPYSLYMSKDQHLWVGDGSTSKILKYDLTGRLLYSWGTFGPFAGGIWGPHQLSVDSENNFYIADVHNGRVQKFTPRPGADPATLVGQR